MPTAPPPTDVQLLTRQATGARGHDPDHPAAARAVVVDAAAGIVDVRGRRNFALVGFSESSRHLVPTDDPEWVLCGLNQLYRHLPRWDVWFDIHSFWREVSVDGTDHAWWLAQCGLPVFMARVEPDVPTSVRFPLERATASGADYFTCTVAYMIAWVLDHVDREVRAQAALRPAVGTLAESAADLRALYGQYKLALIGIDLVAEEEYAAQRPCVEFWLGRAAERGIRVMIPKESALLKQLYRYGYERSPDTGLLRLAELQARGRQTERDLAAAVAQVERLQGRREEQQYLEALLQVRLRGGHVELVEAN